MTRLYHTAPLRFRVSDFDDEGDFLASNENITLEEREARTMASTTALRRDLAPIVRVMVVQETGGTALEVIDGVTKQSPEEITGASRGVEAGVGGGRGGELKG